MRLPGSIYRLGGWLGLRTPPDALPYEELHSRFQEDQEGVYGEFIRRLRPIVFYAARDYVMRERPGATQDDVEDLTDAVFEEFGSEFDNGEPETVLRRFASAIRRVLDEEAFECIALPFYYQLPIYHLQDDEQRRLLAALFRHGLGTESGKDFAQDLAEKFEVTEARALTVLEKGSASLKRIIEKDFTRKELEDFTEGHLP